MLLLLIALLVIASGIVLTWMVPHDGYGTRPAPRSHLDPFEPRNHII